MNVTCIPYHDWRKIEMEGSRTRDAHTIHHLSEHPDIDRILILNRPITLPELILKKKLKTITGELVLKGRNFRLYKVSEKIFVLDYRSKDILGPLRKRKRWFFDSFSKKGLYDAYQICLEFLSIKTDVVLTQNIFSAQFFTRCHSKMVFDAWDNFLLFPENAGFEKDFRAAYQKLAESAGLWITNSEKNIKFYQDNYRPRACVLVKNGVDIETFSKKYRIPDDLAGIPQPIVGFGGKITHLIDYDLLNETVAKHPDKSFVVIGQILDRKVFDAIKQAPNLFYLGDKHYSMYPAYVTNFDIGIVPYVTGHLEHGADSIKVYEYLAAGLNVVGTTGAGMSNLGDFIFVAKNAQEFSQWIDKALRTHTRIELPGFYTWKHKVNSIVGLFNELQPVKHEVLA